MLFLKNEATDLIENKGSAADEMRNEATAGTRDSGLGIGVPGGVSRSPEGSREERATWRECAGESGWLGTDS